VRAGRLQAPLTRRGDPAALTRRTPARIDIPPDAGYRAGMRLTCANHSALPFDGEPDDAAVAAALRRQVEAGLDVVTDGHPGWSDAIIPLLAPLNGVRLGPPVTLPLGLTLAAQPIVEAKLRRLQSPPLAAYRRAAPHAARPLKAVLTGPYTLASAARIATTAYRHAADLAADLSMLLAQDVTALVVAGARLIQIDEPLLLAHPDDAKLVRTLLEPLTDAAQGATVLVSTYGADAASAYAQLNSLPGDVIAVDCAGRDAVVDAVAETGSGKPLAFGIVDAGPAVAAPDALARLLERLLRRYAHDLAWVQPAAGLRGVPVATADAKLRALVSAARAVAG
jgi:methionine synthase II (cobalamin-independent)